MSSVQRKGRRSSTLAIIAVLLFLAAAMVAIGFVGYKGPRPEGGPVVAAASTDERLATRESVSRRTASATPTQLAGSLAYAEPGPERPALRSQATFYDLTRDKVTGTGNQHEPWPALSLVKLYIADHVVNHGTVEDGYLALEMIATSDDDIAEDLYRKHPASVDKVARYYGLENTVGGQHWGISRTSMYDVVSFLAQLQERDPHDPIFTAMSLSTPHAADGYHQDFGTDILPGAYGTKWGWSNDLSLHASVTVGEGWIAAAAIDGGAEQLTDFARAQFTLLATESTARAQQAVAKSS